MRVGDDEQSIFAWTGADPIVLERFRRDTTSSRSFSTRLPLFRQIFETARRVLARIPACFRSS